MSADDIMEWIRARLEMTDAGQAILGWPLWAFSAATLALGATWVIFRSVRPLNVLLRPIYFFGSLGLIVLASAHSFEAGGATLVAFVVTAIPVAAFASPSRPRILLLRRFHSESGRTAISGLFDQLTLQGYDCVTLADSQVKRDRLTAFGLTSLLAGTIVLTLYAVMFGATLSMLFDPMYSLGSTAFTILSLALFIVVSLAFAIIGMRQTKALSIWLNERMTPARSAGELFNASGAIALPSRFRRPWQGGLTVLLTTDADWRTVVVELLRSAERVCVDLYAPSLNIAEELGFIQQLDCADKVIWLEPHGEQCVALETNGYIVLGVRFAGRPTVWRYPVQIGEEDSLIVGGRTLSRLAVRFRDEMLGDAR